tara:strand:- start:1195 stop:1743 length:549 start_codon:yes stop_codon:yes gene_type:complete
MAKISTYPKDTNISLSDKLLGTDAESSLATKNYEIGDFVTFIQGQFNTTLQDVTEEGANTTVQMQINGVNVATVNDIDIIPTFKAFITQAGSATPIFSTVSKNTTGKTFTIARQNAGVFLIEPNVPFTNIEKVFISVQNQGGYNVLNSISISNTQLFWLTYDFNGVSGDLIDYSTITIEILP